MGRNSVMPIALPTIDLVIGAQSLLVSAIASGESVTFDNTHDSIGNFAPSQYGTGRILIDGHTSIHGVRSAGATVTIRLAK